MRRTILLLLLIVMFFKQGSAQNVTYTSLYDDVSFNSRTIDLSLAVGSTAGSGDANGGAANYSIPIVVPPGTNGVVPSIAIIYNSLGRGNILGMGWGISGLSAIMRTNRNMYFDAQTNPVIMTNEDRFTLDGVRLISKTGTYGAAETTYGLEVENFSKVTSKSAQGNGPEWFEVITKDGVKMEYGNTVDSRLTGQFATVLTWALNKIQYPDGNYITFKYKTDAYFSLLIDEINYAGNDNAGILPYNLLKFNYLKRTTDKNTVYENNTRINSEYLLDKITVKAEGVTSKSYQFNYGHDNINSLLKEVIEGGSDGSALNATIFKYGNPPAELTTVSTDGYQNPSSTTITGDFNADGLTDFLEARLETSPAPSKYVLTVYTKYLPYTATPDAFSIANVTELPAGYSVVKKQEIPNSYDFLAYDFTGDGADDVLMTNVAGTGTNRTLNSLNLYKSIQNYGAPGNGQFPVQFESTVIAPYTGYSRIHPSGHFVFPGDFDGDGVQDILTMLGSSTTNYNCHLYNGRVQSTFGTIAITGDRFFELADWPTVDKVHVVDFNGDGKSDLMLIKGNTCEIFTFDTWNTRRIHYSTTFLNKDHLSYFGDFNGDRKTDILAKLTTTGAWKILISNGQYFYESSFSFEATPNTTPLTGDHLAVGDFNGDGKSDIYHGWDVVGSSTLNMDVYYGKGFNYDLSAGVTFHRVRSTPTINQGALQPMIGDFNGDGRMDAINFKSITTPMDIFYFRKEGREYLLEKVKNGINHLTEWAYKKLTDESGFYTRGNLTAYPLNTFQPPIYTVSEVKSLNGMGGTTAIQFTYAGARLHRAGKGFLGFQTVTSSNQATGVKTVSENEFNDNYFVAVPKETSKYLGPSTLISKTTLTNTFVEPASKRFWVKTNISDNRALEGATISTANIYDDYGNITKCTVVGGAETTITDNIYEAFVSSVPNKATNTTITQTRTGDSPFSTKTKFVYNSKGQLSEKINFYQQPKAVTTVYGYDNFGNVNSTTVSASDITTRSTGAVYDSKGRYAEATTNELGYVSHATYDAKWGKPLTTTGVDDLVTSYTYDVFGRPKTTTVPGDYIVTHTLAWDVPDYADNKVWKTTTTYSPSGRASSTEWFDLLGRSVRTETAAFDGTATGADKTYDVKGNLKTSEQPHKSSESFITTSYGYDQYNRISTSDQGALGKTTYTYSYASGNRTVNTSKTIGTSLPFNSASKTTDITGKVTSVTDNGGTLAYTYYSHGGLKSIVRGNVTLTLSEYDIYGRQKKLIDLNAGTTEYLYNSNGELTWQKNANLKEHSMLYDLAGRIITRTGPEGTTTNEYYTDNSNGKSKGKIKKITGFTANNQTEYEYNDKGQLKNLKETIDNIPQTTSFLYNAYGDVTTTTYPSLLQVTQTYNSNGFLSSINGAGTLLYTTQEMNGQGQVTKYRKNTFVSTVVYENGFPKIFSTSGIQNYQLDWDFAKGNLKKRVDARAAGRVEEFTCDNLDRLTDAVITPATGPQSIFKATYAQNGNINSKTDAGGYSYAIDKINAVVSVVNPGPEPPIPLLQQDIAYTAFNQPSTVSENGNLLTYTYGADYNRIKSELTSGGITQYTRYYFSGGFEKVGITTPDRYIQYITSPVGLIAIIETSGGTNTVHYTYTDHLGSILTTVTPGGSIEVEQSFDAWGRRRLANTWKFPTAQQPLPTRPAWLTRGYTGHEHIDQFGLINMNGRLYDPALGRMLSPDNFIPSGGFTQDFNRYTYARNNPLVYTDPDGEFVNIMFLTAAFSAEFLSNVITGKSSAFRKAAKSAFKNTNDFGSIGQFTVASGENWRFTAGFDVFAIGISANFTGRLGDLSVGSGIGGGVGGYNYNWGISYSPGKFDINFGGGGGENHTALGGGLKYNGFGASYYQTQYGSSKGPDGISNAQTVGGLGIYAGNFSFRIENDFFAFNHQDRWRSNAVEIGWGNFSVGTRLYNNDPKGGNQGTVNSTDMLGNENDHGYTAWEHGKVYHSPLWVGLRTGNSIGQIGYSHPLVQDRTQNFIHLRFPPGRQNFYVDYDSFIYGSYLFTGYYNSYSLWGR